MAADFAAGSSSGGRGRAAGAGVGPGAAVDFGRFAGFQRAERCLGTGPDEGVEVETEGAATGLAARPDDDAGAGDADREAVDGFCSAGRTVRHSTSAAVTGT